MSVEKRKPLLPLQMSAMYVADGGFNFLAPAGRHVYSTRDTETS